MAKENTMNVKVSSLHKGDVIDAGGTRRRATVESVSEWGTGSVSVQVWSRGKLSQVWFRSIDSLVELADRMTTWTPAQIAGADLEPGMFVDRTYRCERTGPKGGRYYVRAYRVESAVTAVEPTESLVAKDGIRVRFARGGAIFVLPEQRIDVRIPTEEEQS